MVGKTAAAAVAIGLFFAACAGNTAGEAQAAGPHAVAVDFALDRGHGEANSLVYVAEPTPEMWDQWCGFEADLDPCRALQAMTIDLAAPFPADVATEIESALAPRDVEFIDDPGSALEDAGLLSFGRAIEVDGKIYLPVDAVLEGWLFELTPTDQGWDIDVLAQWIA